MKYYKNITVCLTVGVQEMLAARQGREETTHMAAALGTYEQGHQARLKICNTATNEKQNPLSASISVL